MFFLQKQYSSVGKVKVKLQLYMACFVIPKLCPRQNFILLDYLQINQKLANSQKKFSMTYQELLHLAKLHL